jgi:hypothetical protein
MPAVRGRRMPQDFVRLTFSVRTSDVSLLRGVVEALEDPKREADMRALLLRWHFSNLGATGFKALLAAAPLEGVDLTRDRRPGRDVDL